MMSQNGLVCRPWLLNGVTFPILTCATMGAAKAAAEGVYYVCKKGNISADDFECILKRMGEEAVYWGTTACVFAVTKTGLELVFCNHRSMKTFIASLVTSAVVSTVESKNNNINLMDTFVRGTICVIVLALTKVDLIFDFERKQ